MSIQARPVLTAPDSAAVVDDAAGLDIKDGDESALPQAAPQEMGFGRLIRTKFVGHVGRLMSFNVLSALIVFGQGILVARWLGPMEYGIATLVMNFPTLLFGLLDARTGTATVRYFMQFRQEGRGDKALALCKMTYLMDLAIAALTFGAVCLLATWAERHIVKASGYAPLMILFSAAFLPRAFVGTSSAVFAALSQFRLSAWLDVAGAVLRAGVTLFLVQKGAGVAGVIWGGLAASVFSGAASTVVCHSLLMKEHRASWLTAPLGKLKGHFREILRFVLCTDLTELLGVLVKQFDVTLLGFFSGPHQVGLYRLAKSLAGSLGLVVSPLQTVIYPRMATPGAQQTMQNFFSSVRNLLKRWGLAALVCLGLFIYAGPNLFIWAAGPAYAPMLGAARVLLLAYAVWLLLFWMRPFYFGHGLVGAWARGMVIYSIAFLVLGPLLGRSHGALGMALAYSVVTIGFYIVMLWRLFPRFRTRPI